MTASDPLPDKSRNLAHIAVIMDGNGRWAERRRLPRVEGHRNGLRAARRLVENVAALGVSHLTLFAFSNENWRRPSGEVGALLSLFSESLADAGESFRQHRIRLRFIGDNGRFPKPLRKSMAAAEELTAQGDRMTLLLAIGYSGRWDILRAAMRLAADGDSPTEENFSRRLATGDAPPPDLLIRTGGEMRISNFLLWQAAYAELYFTDTLWPDFGDDDLRRAIADFNRRERRFGRVVGAPPASKDAAV